MGKAAVGCFYEKVEFDMSSMGGGQPSTLTAKKHLHDVGRRI
jgi:hypothetical protein